MSQTPSGTATILAEQTSVTVPYSWSPQPSFNQIYVTPIDDLGGRTFSVNPNTFTATTFEIDISSIDMQNHSFNWQIFVPGTGPGTGSSTWVPFTPAFTTLPEVINHLNITGPDTNNNYSVFGLKISVTTVQSQIDHANKYISSIVPTLQEGTVDPRLPSAELAATDLACLGILVASVGGAMIGTYDYFLGDMRVARSTPYASAIKTAIDGFRSSAASNLKNVSIVAVGAKANISYRVPHFRDKMF